MAAIKVPPARFATVKVSRPGQATNVHSFAQGTAVLSVMQHEQKRSTSNGMVIRTLRERKGLLVSRRYLRSLRLNRDCAPLLFA